MKNKLFIIPLILLNISCQNLKTEVGSNPVQETDYSQFVNPFVGTSKMGHTFPGATAPFGMVQLSPQTNFEQMFKADGQYNSKTYEYCAGYQYRDSIIIGFSHTNFSGTGHAGLLLTDSRYVKQACGSWRFPADAHHRRPAA